MFPYGTSLQSPNQTEDLEYEFWLNTSTGSKSMIVLKNITVLEYLALDLMLSMTLVDADCSIFQGFAKSVEEKNVERPVSVINAFSACLFPEDEESQSMEKIQKQYYSMENVSLNTEWRVDFKKLKDPQPSSNSRVETFMSTLNSLSAMFSGRSDIAKGLGLETDSQTVQTIARQARDAMENQYNILKTKKVDALDRLDIKRFHDSISMKPQFSVSGSFSTTTIPLQANSTSILINHNGDFKWIACSDAANVTKTDFSFYSSPRKTGTGRGIQNVLEIFGLKARSAVTQGFYSIADGLKWDGELAAKVKEGWHLKVSNNAKKRVKPIGVKVVKRGTAFSDSLGLVVGDGHITIRDGQPVYHLPVSAVESWKVSDGTSKCSAPANDTGTASKRPASKEINQPSKKRELDSYSKSIPAKPSTAPASASQSIPTPAPANSGPSRKRGSEEGEGPAASSDKKRKSNKCDCSGCHKKKHEYAYQLTLL